MDFAPAEISEEAQERASSFVDSLDAVNMDEITISTVKVAIRDSRFVPALDDQGNHIIEDGKQKVRRQFYTRIAEIENYVPMSIFNKMMATRAKVMRQRQEYLANPTDEQSDPIIRWMMEQVLAVWKLTEEDMDMDRLESGLEFNKFSRLFTLFFGHLL